ncbi:sodium-dependent transporter [Haloplanus litoreus]|uniref:sodium-dependent transporter n=1 Tax=Haloplanus litoreus TaxID=767515 RepID=UPI00361ECA83
MTGGVVSMGVRGGIERMAKVVMPTVFVLLVVLALYAVTLSEWEQAAAFLFTPEFSVLTDLGLWSAAFGQVFFSMSVGQGIMLTYGSYVEEETDLFKSSFVITVADIGAAIVAGLVIFPIVFSFGLQPTLGTELAFTTLPTAFAAMPFGQAIAIGFFGLLFFAALSSSVALLEVGVAAAENTTRLSRRRATLLLTGGVFVAGVPSALSYSPTNLAIAGRPVLDLVDESVGTFALPISALCIVFVFVWAADLGTVREELGPLYPFVRYLIPVVLVVVTAARTVGIARPAWRLVVDHTRNGPLGLLVAAALLLVVAVLGWGLRNRLPAPPRLRGRRRCRGPVRTELFGGERTVFLAESRAAFAALPSGDFVPCRRQSGVPRGSSRRDSVRRSERPRTVVGPSHDSRSSLHSAPDTGSRTSPASVSTTSEPKTPSPMTGLRIPA